MFTRCGENSNFLPSIRVFWWTILKSPNFCLCTDVALALVKVLLHLNTGKNWPLKAQYAQTELFRILFCFTWSFVPGRLWVRLKKAPCKELSHKLSPPIPLQSVLSSHTTKVWQLLWQTRRYSAVLVTAARETQSTYMKVQCTKGSSLGFSPGQCF